MPQDVVLDNGRLIDDKGNVVPASALAGASEDSWLHAFLNADTDDLADQTDLVWRTTTVQGNGTDIEVLADISGTSGRTIRFNTTGRYDLFLDPALSMSVDCAGSLGLVCSVSGTPVPIPMLSRLNGSLDTVITGGNANKIAQPLWLPSIPIDATATIRYLLNGSVLSAGSAHLNTGTGLYVRKVA